MFMRICEKNLSPPAPLWVIIRKNTQKQTNQNQKEGLGAVNQACVLATKCAVGRETTNRYGSVLLTLVF